MGNRHVILFFVLGIILCVLVSLGTKGRFSLLPADSEARVGVRLFDGPLEDVDHLTLDNRGAHLGLIRQGERWVMTAPFSAEVDQAAVLKVLDLYEAARIRDAIPFADLRKKGFSLQEFGLSPAVAHILFEGPHFRRQFSIGGFSPTGKDIYLRMDNQEWIAVAAPELFTALPDDANGFRLRRLMTEEIGQVRSLEIRQPGKPFIHLDREASGWFLRQPFTASASDERVSTILSRLTQARIERFVWPSVSNVMDVAQSESQLKVRRGLYGLDPDRGVSVIVQTLRESEPRQWVFGARDKEASGYSYVLLPNGESIGLVSNAVADVFRVVPGDLRDLRLFSENPDSVNRVKIVHGETTFVLARTNGVWSLEAPISDRADQLAVSEALAALLSLHARSTSESVEEGVNEKVIPFSRVELDFAGGSRAFSIGHDDLAGASLQIDFTDVAAHYHVDATNMPAPFLSMDGLLTLREKTLVSISKDSIRRLTGKDQEGGVRVLEQKGEQTAWQMTCNDQTEPVDEAKLAALFTVLANLKAKRIEKLGVSLEDLQTYGFRQPWFELTIDVKSADAVRKAILIGNSAGADSRYAMVRGANVLFVLSGETVKTLRGIGDNGDNGDFGDNGDGGT
ncbi:MAG: DUF4340 domain-containing protein [Kiritimatiellae bacterium]|nr:DUF4340 domain-containing protein [Kiritimatiellia bacterium]